MTLIAVERMKLFSTRSAWWSILLALGLTVGFAAMLAANTNTVLTPRDTQTGYQLGLMVMLVLGALVVTSEYRFGTLKATFLAHANRTHVLLAKTALVFVLSGIVGEIAAFGSLGAGRVFAARGALSLNAESDWRSVAGVGLVFAFAGVLALAVGTLLRQTAGAVTLLLIWPLLLEQLVAMVPRIGDAMREWMPFRVADHFLTGTPGSTMPYGPWAGLGYFAAVTAVLLIVAIGVTGRRDA